MPNPAFLPVFAGLGSEALFSAEALDRAAQDALVPECAVLLRACHEAFVTQVTQAVDSQLIGPDVIRLADFASPSALVRPPPRYCRHNVLMQHVTLYLQQVLRHLASAPSREPGKLVAAAGFCVGLLPAAALATAGASSDSSLALISRALDFFRVALWVGIHSECHRRTAVAREVDLDTPRSCSYVVDGLSPDAAAQLLPEGGHVFLSAVLSPTRVVLSGIPSELASFVSHKLPQSCRARPTQVFSLYHDSRLSHLRHRVFDDVGKYEDGLLQTEIRLAAPLLSASTGEPLALPSPSQVGDLVAAILDEVFLQPVDWVAVQASIASLAGSQSDPRSETCPVHILNYGPGVGMSHKASSALPDNVDIIDASLLAVAAGAVSKEDIAIVGMAVDLPGAADCDTLWEGLMQGTNTCTEIPASRFDVQQYSGDGHNQQARKRGGRVLNARHGNFLENPFLFDAELFDISRREAKSMDPQQRILLHTAYRALEDAGYVPDSSPSFCRDTFGCWVGNATLDYVDNMRDDIDVYYSPGTLRAFLSARISYVFGWSGPSITLDTACSSSIVALHQAARAIMAGECRAALVGAANTITSPDMYLGLDRAHFLSPSGQCKAFDASADGYCRAEGCGVFVIKKLSDAIAEGDRIHAVIKAVEINHSGNAHSITHPHVPTQEALFTRMFQKARIDPREVSAVELHGTGTQAGDPNEVESVRRVLCAGRDARKQPLHLTSIKANIGHAEAASGMAGLAKLVLMLRHGRIPPQVSLHTLNPRIRQLGSDGAVIVTDRQGAEWPRTAPGRPRLAMLNNFGAAGSNAAVLVAEHIDSKAIPLRTPATTLVCGFSAKSERAIAALQRELAARLAEAAAEAQGPRFSLGDVCATLTSRRQVYDWRVTVTASSVGELAEKIRTAAPRRVVRGGGPWTRPEAVFVFSGQGSQYLGMGRELMAIYSEFAETVLQCDRWLVENGYPGCRAVIEASSESPAETQQPNASSRWQAFQSALFVLEVALARLLISWGIAPTAVVGHSLGEYAALVTAGVVDLFDGLKLVAHRASLMMQHCEVGHTSMLAVNCSADTMEALLRGDDDRFAGVEVACRNSGTDCVVGGPVPVLSGLKTHLGETRGIKSKLLDVPLAFHTQAMDPMMAEFRAFAAREAGLSLSAPTVPVVSNVLGRTVRPGEEDVFSAGYFADHCRNAVAFDDGIKDFLAGLDASAAALRFIEVGPHPSILPMLRPRALRAATSTAAGAREPELLPVLTKASTPDETVSRLLRHFYETGGDGINWRKVFMRRGKTPRRLPVDLPTMPFFKEEFYTPYRESRVAVQEEVPEPTLVANSFAARAIQRLPPGSGDGQAVYDTPAPLLKDFIAGHLVCDQALCPASVYHEMALVALADTESGAAAGSWSLTKIKYLASFVYREDQGGSEQVLRVVLSRKNTHPDGYEFTILSYSASSDPDTSSTTHCRGIVRRNTQDSLKLKYPRLWASAKGRMSVLLGHPSSDALLQVFSRSAMYDKIFPRVVTYSEPYQMVRSIHVNDTTGEAFAACEYPKPRLGSDGAIPAANAIFMDVLLHVAGFVANLRVANDIMGICTEVGAATVLRAPEGGATGAPFEIFCSTFEMSGQEGGVGSALTIAEAYAMDAHGLLAVFKGMVFQHVSMARIRLALGVKQPVKQQHQRAVVASVDNNPKPAPSRGHPSISTSTIASPPPVSPAVVDVRDLVAKACGLGSGSTLAADSALDAIGVDSLLMIELHSDLSSVMGVGIPHDALAECATVGDIESLVSSLRYTSGNATTTTARSAFPDSAADSASSASSSTTASPCTPDTTSSTPGTGGAQAASMTEIIANVCGADPRTISPDSELRSLGIDSLMTLELEDTLRATYGVDISSLGVQHCRTVADVAKLIGRPSSRNGPLARQVSAALARLVPHVEEDDPTSLPPFLSEEERNAIPHISRLLHLTEEPELIQSPPRNHPPAAPIFLIHDGSGICTHYRRLRPLHRPVFALHDPRFLLPLESNNNIMNNNNNSSSSPWPDLPTMATHYADLISSSFSSSQAQQQQPCILGGWSFGGVVAFEAARTLLARGDRPVAGVVLIDAPPPVRHVPLSEGIIRAVTTTESSRSSNATATAMRKLIHRSFSRCASLLGAFSAALGTTTATTTGAEELRDHDPRPIPCVIVLRAKEGWVPPAGYSSSSPVFPGEKEKEYENAWLQDRRDPGLATRGWEEVTGQAVVRCIDIPGNHFSVFGKANVGEVSAAVGRACQELLDLGGAARPVSRVRS